MKTLGVHLYDLGFGNSFLDVTPKAQAAQENRDKLDFCASKDTIKRMKRQSRVEENICKSYI